MDKMTTELNIMIDGLKRKSDALMEILSITENQRTVIESELPIDEVRNIIFQMNEGKQEAIKIVRSCDDMFEAMLKDMGAELEARQDDFKPQVAKMQEGIRRVMDYDVKIRVGEEENNRLLDEKRGEIPTVSGGIKPKTTPVPLSPVKVAKAYEEGQKNYKG